MSRQDELRVLTDAVQHLMDTPSLSANHSYLRETTIANYREQIAKLLSPTPQEPITLSSVHYMVQQGDSTVIRPAEPFECPTCRHTRYFMHDEARTPCPMCLPHKVDSVDASFHAVYTHPLVGLDVDPARYNEGKE